MKMGRGGAVHRDLGQLFEGRSIAGLGEGQLLERFVERRDGPAFDALMARHGPMVLGVCRRLLSDPLDVEDAFQATFLVLVRRASSLRERDRLAPWLFGVARKVATRARLDLARRRARECSGAEEIAATSESDEQRRELGRALVEEIDRLPGSLREPIVLCCVEGLTYDDAASRLRTTAPAIRGRLSRARERLRVRLTRRGFAPSAAALGTLLSASAASATVPRVLLLTTTRASLAGMVPASVEALAEGVIRTMILTKSKILAVALVACGVAGTGLGVSAQQDAPKTSFRRTATSEADRFDQLEKKLDRLIEALEGSNRPVVAPATTPPPTVFSRDTGYTPVTTAVPAGPAAYPTPPALPAVPAPPGAPPAGTPGAMTSMMMAGQAPHLADRLSVVEQKLGSLEARIANLERRLGPERDIRALPKASDPFSTPRKRPNTSAADPTSPWDDSDAPRPKRRPEATKNSAPAERNPEAEQPK